MIGAMFASLGKGKGKAVISFDDSKAFTVKDQKDYGKYVFTGIYAKNPVTGNIIHTFHSGTTHVFDTNKTVSAVKSTDGGATHGTPFVIADPLEGGVQDTGGGYDSKGRLHVFYDLHEGFATSDKEWFRYRYSDDDGATFSTPVDIPVAEPSTGSFRSLGKMIESNGVLIKPYYMSFVEDGVNKWGRYILRSEDYGATWTIILLEKNETEINEGSVIGVGNTLIYAARIEVNTRGYRLYKSTDLGLTWTVQGDTSFGESMTTSHPPHLAKFKLNGVEVFAFYYVNRNTKEFKAVYGLPSKVFAGVDGWNLNTKTVFTDFDTYSSVASGTAPTATSGYGMVEHIDNDLNAKGMQYLDFGTSTPTNTIYFDLPTTHYSTIKTELGI